MEEQKTISIKLEDGQDVVYETRLQIWTLSGVNEELVRKIAPDKAKAIDKALEKQVTEFQERIKREEEEKEAKRIAGLKVQLDTFKAEVAQLVSSGYETRFYDVNEKFYGDVRHVRIEKDGVDSTVEYDNRVSDGWRGGHTTDKPWKVEFNYKYTRYSTLQKAVVAAIKNINEKLADKAKKVALQQEEFDNREALKQYIEQYGINYTTESHWVRTGPNHGYECITNVALMVAKQSGEYDKMVVRGDIRQRNDGSVLICNPGINAKFTPEQFKKLVEFIREMDPEY